MNKKQWETSRDPDAMLHFVMRSGKISDRRIRLFVCACCRMIWDLYADDRSRRAILASEEYADGNISDADLHHARSEAWNAVNSPHYIHRIHGEAANTVARVVTSAILPALWMARSNASRQAQDEWRANTLRDIVGNPRGPVAFDPGWATPTVTALAQAAYSGRAFDRMPVLGDALEEAGCDHAEVLAHCRSKGEHVRGCWVVDLVLGKS